MNIRRQSLLVGALVLLWTLGGAQERNYNPYPMMMDVGNFKLSMNKLNGEGGLQSQYSWMLVGANPSVTELFFWPQDGWQTNMLYQIFNPVSLGDSGIVDENGVRQSMYTRGDALTNKGTTDWSSETRRYRPPQTVVDGLLLSPQYRWNVDRTIPSDIKIEFEDVLNQFGIRSHVEMYAFSNPELGDFFIWKATQKFTGEWKRPRETTSSKDSLPDQTIQLWWPIAFSFGPSKIGEYNVIGGFSYEGEDDLDSWFSRKSALVPGRSRDSLMIAYYWDDTKGNAATYPSTGSNDETGDPDRVTGHLYSTQIPGYALLYADQAPGVHVDDPAQPYAMPHASIVADLWNRRDEGLKLTYRGDDGRGRFPLDAITMGFSTSPEKGPMRFLTMGPYLLTKNAAAGRFDSVTFVVAVGAGGASWHDADSVGRAWFNKQITDQQKRDFVLKGRDSLFTVLDRANWAWDRISHGLPIPAAPEPPDIDVESGPDRITVNWSYPDPSYFLDAVTNVDDWKAWRVYRKRGAFFVDDPNDQKTGVQWTLVYETNDRTVTTFVDTTVQRGVDYYYAVTAVDDGTQNSSGLFTGQSFESSRFVNRSPVPAVPFKAGLSENGKVLVVPNPATTAAGGLGFSGTPDKILFVNLPYRCTLKVFTETGDLVTTIDHVGTADHAWNQRTDDNQYITSGIYILTVSNATDVNGKSLDNALVKFVVVR